ncbi:hypothetical protein SLEP1_g49880 [Rubroshorea leprosula]|uniref:Uncharacterized protein n=1 Tax=Rubroshorea leprosula TaxID=152421 RepID=A0AAV5LY75_9ROSI|nr:hypothetical protein SLEP1_g49880 [Rubroshorea leprosula]
MGAINGPISRIHGLGGSYLLFAEIPTAVSVSAISIDWKWSPAGRVIAESPIKRGRSMKFWLRHGETFR